MVEAIGRQLDRCSVCGKKVHKRDLVLTQVDFMSPSGSNYINYSSYSASGWTTSGLTDKGVISIGPYADRARVVISDDNTRTESFGSQTWSGDGHLYTSDSLDVSSWTSLVFAADVGPYHRSTSRGLTVILQSCQSDGTVDDTIATWTIDSDTRVWGTINVADMTGTTSAAYFRIDATPDTGQYWWVDRVQVIKDVSKLGTFIPTSGSSVDQAGARSMTMQKVCSHCYEPLLSRTEQFNRRAEQRTDDPVSVWNQSF